MLQDIDDNRMAAYVAHRRACRVFDQNEKDKRKSTRAVSNATINREISTFRKMHNLAREVWDVEVGKISFPRHMLKESDCRIRWETPENITKLVDAAADHLKQPIRFALYTGARLSNIMNCKIEDIDFKNRTIRFHVKSSKPGGKFHMVPMVDELYDMITLEMGVDPKARGHLFTYDGQPMKQFRRSWKTACKNAGVEDFRFHDLRHTCASWLIQRGVPIEIVREILGHADIKTTMKYAHHKKEAHREALQMVFAAQSRHNDTKRKRRKAA